MQEPAGAAVLVAAGEGRRALEEPAEVFVGGTQSASGLMRTAAPISASDTGRRPLGSESSGCGHTTGQRTILLQPGRRIMVLGGYG